MNTALITQHAQEIERLQRARSWMQSFGDIPVDDPIQRSFFVEVRTRTYTSAAGSLEASKYMSAYADAMALGIFHGTLGVIESKIAALKADIKQLAADA